MVLNRLLLRGCRRQFAAPRFWSPSAISPFAWYDAQTESTLTKPGNVVSQWRDRSANTRNLDSNNQPAYSATALNGLPALTTSASQLMFYSAFPASTPAAGIADKLAVFAVGSVSNTSFGPLFSWRNVQLNDDATNSGAQVLTGSGFNSQVIAVRNNVLLSTKAVTIDAPHIFGSVFDGTNHTMYVDGSAGSPVASSGNFDNTSGQDPWYMTFFGNFNTGGSSFWRGAAGEIIVVIGEVTTGNRQRIEGYLAHRWGLTNGLAGDHPYKSSPPLA